MTTTGDRLKDELARAREAPAEPCGRCGVRADVGCKHRGPQGLPPVAVADPRPKIDARSHGNNGGQGWAMHRDRFPAAMERARKMLSTKVERHGE